MDISYLDEPRFLWAQYTGPWTIEELVGTAAPVVAECQSRKQALILFDCTLLRPRPMAVGERFQLASSILLSIGIVKKVAFAAPASIIDSEKFGERVARNRGVNLRVFEEVERAKHWLLEADESRPAGR